MAEFQKLKSKFTEEDIEDIQQNVKKIDRTWTHIMEMCTILHRCMPAWASPLIMATLVPVYGSLLLNIDEKEDY
jgi:hypothetical protein